MLIEIEVEGRPFEVEVRARLRDGSMEYVAEVCAAMVSFYDAREERCGESIEAALLKVALALREAIERQLEI